jgi:hypothetical protein
MKLNLGILLILVLQGAAAYAGVGAHGGNVVVCPGRDPVTLDYYNAALPTAAGPVSVVDVSHMSEDQAFQFVRSRFDGTPFQETFDYAAKYLGPVSSWIAADLKSVNDSNEPYVLPPNCVRKTAAIRQENTMYLDPTISSTLSPGQIGLLHAHEVLYYISNLDSSAAVRDLFRVIMATSLDWNLFDRYMQPFGLLASWEYLISSGWVETPGPSKTLPGRFVLDLYKEDSPRTMNYAEFGAKPPYELRRAEITLSCDLASQTCEFVGQTNSVGKVQSFVGCKMRVPSRKTMTLDCPQFGGTKYFNPTNTF